MNENASKGFFESDTARRLLPLVIVVAGLYLFLPGIGSYPLWDPWEPKYAQSIREMQERDDFITPYFNDKIRWTKPILIYWVMYGSLLVFGDNEFAARLPSVLAAVAGLLLMYFFLERLRGRRTALIGACVLATLPQYFFLARQAMPDMLLTLFLTAAMGFLALARFGSERKGLYFGLFYAAVALAMLTKGPVACAIVAGAVLLFWLIDIEPRRLLSPRTLWADVRAMLASYRVGLGLLVFTAVAAPWYGMMLLRHGYSFIHSFFWDENLRRFSEPLFGHNGDISTYFLTMFHGMYPWFSLLPPALLFLFHGRSKIDEELRQRWYFLAWMVWIFVLFTGASTKIDHYVFPMAPAVAVLVALVWETIHDKQAPYWLRPVFLLSLLFALLPARDFLLEGNGYIMDTFVPYLDIEVGWERIDLAVKIVIAAWCAVILLACLMRHSRLPIVLAVLIAYGNGIFLTHYVMPAHAPARNLKAYTEIYRESRQPDSVLVFYGRMRYSMHYYLGKDQFVSFEPEQLAKVIDYVRDRPDAYVIAQEMYFDSLLSRLHGGTDMRWTTVSREHPLFVLIRSRPQRE